MREALSPKYAQLSYLDSNTKIKVHYSFPAAIKVGCTGYLFPVLGHVTGTDQKVLALSEIHASTINIPPSWVYEYDIPKNEEPDFLLQASLNLLATAILSSISSNETIVVHDAEPSFATVLADSSQKKGIKTIFTTSKNPLPTEGVSWLSINRNTSKDVGTFVQLSPTTDPAIENLIKNSLPRYHKTLNRFSFLRPSVVVNSFNMDSSVFSELSDTISDSLGLKPLASGAVNLSGLSQISSEPYGSFSTVVDWTPSASTLVTVEPVDSKQLFAKNRTYFLAGLAGDLGRSLTKWMVQHGARYIVLTSRNPKIEERWLKSFEGSGATVQVFSK